MISLPNLSKKIIAVTGFSIAILLSSTAVLAQSSSDIKLIAMPARYGDSSTEKLLLQPGKTQEFSIKVNNDSQEVVTISSLAEDFIVDDENGVPTAVEMEELDNRWSMAKWITLTPAKQSIKPGETVGVNVTIEVPADALPGGRYAMIMHQPSDNTQLTISGNNTNLINQRVGTLVYGIVEGPITEAAFIRDLQTPSFLEFGPVNLSFLIDNDSDVHISPQISVKYFNMLGQEIDSTTIESKNIFPKNSRTFEYAWQKIWGFGQYKAEVTMLYGTFGTQTAIASTSFWILPWRLIVAVITVVLVLIVLFIVIRRHLKHRQNQQSKLVKELEEKVAKLELEKTQE